MKKLNILTSMILAEFKKTCSLKKTAKACHFTAHYTRQFLMDNDPNTKFKARHSRTAILSNEEQREYVKWVKAVLFRDEYKCQLCGDGTKITPHHIRTWIKYPDLRYNVNNGITLCKKCHYKTYKCEEEWEEQLSALITNRGLALPFVPKKYEGPPTEMVCSKCNKTLPISEFFPHSMCKWKVMHVCKVCHRKWTVEYHAREAVMIKVRNDKWRRSNKERRHEYLIRHGFELSKKRGRVEWSAERAKLGLVCAREEDFRSCAM